ncbi:hypothetical protein Tco_0623944 [Tanacetum coccineum]|uniref:Uncharacterized protein n=1 Tax=Tanacetum coccineum TaxID=301880 RepID=A0ABQ4WCG1_9ASTR
MLLAMKDKARSNLNNEENDFMLDTSYGEETMEELIAAVMLMAQVQPADGNAETVPSYDAKAVSEINASFKVHEQMRHEKRKTIIQTSDDQINSNVIFDDPYVENNGGTNDKNTIERLLKEKDNIQSDFFKIENEKIIIQHETQLAKKAFKERENRYLEDICDLEEKLSSHDRIVYKMGQSIQTIHMLGKTPNKVYDPFLKAGLGYKNPERLKKAIAAQPKMYDGEKLHSVNLKIDSPDSEETLEDVEESRLKMRNKMVQINYGKLNALYETFVPQQDFSMEQTYFSIPSTSTNGSESKAVTSDLPILKMPKETTWTQHKKELDELIEHVNQNTNDYADVHAQNQNLLITISELKNKLKTIDNGKNVNTKFDISVTLGTLFCVTPLLKNIAIKAKKVSNSKVNTDRSKLVTSHPTPTNEQESSNSVTRQKSKDTKSKNRVLKNTNAKSSTAHVRKMSRSVSIDSNKCETMNLTLRHANKSVLNTKNVTAVNDGSNIVCVSYGKDMFLLSRKKCVARYALSRNSNVKRALFTTPVAAKSKNLRATSVVVKSRLSVANTPKATNKVFSASSLSHASSQSKTLSNYMKNKIATSQKWQRWFEYQQSFNWSPKSKTAQSLPSETKSRIRVHSTSNTPVTTHKWVAKLSTLLSAFVSCDAGDSARPLDC